MKRYVKSGTANNILTKEERIRLFGEDPKGEVVIPDDYTTIGKYAFGHCESLTDVIIPDSVTSIGNWAFGFCTSLTSVKIPNSVTSIGDWAFGECESLASVIIGKSVTRIGEGAFCDCWSLTSITIPNSITSIGAHAFEYCKSLTDVTFLGDMKSIELQDQFYHTPVYEDMKRYIKSSIDSRYDPDDYDEIYSAYSVPESDDALWDVMDDVEFEFLGVQDVGYDEDDNIMIILNHAISADMIEPLAEELLAAFRQHGYPVHDWHTNGSNVYILTP